MNTATPATTPAKSLRTGEGQILMVLGMPHIIKITADQNLAGTSVSEVIVAPGQGVPPHTHTHEDEFFYILQGELTCTLQGEPAPITLRTGDFLFLPRNRTHGFTNASAKETRMMVTASPGANTDHMFIALEKACRQFSSPDQLMPELSRICQAHGVIFAPPSH